MLTHLIGGPHHGQYREFKGREFPVTVRDERHNCTVLRTGTYQRFELAPSQAIWVGWR